MGSWFSLLNNFEPRDKVCVLIRILNIYEKEYVLNWYKYIEFTSCLLQAEVT